MPSIPIDSDTLTPGSTLRGHLYSGRGVKLLNAGTELTPELCASLRQLVWRGAYLVEPTEPASVAARIRPAAPWSADIDDVSHAEGEGPPPPRRPRLREAEELVAERADRWAQLPLRIASGDDPLTLEEAEVRAVLDPAALIRERAEQVSHLRVLQRRLFEGVLVPVDEPLGLVDDLLGGLKCRPDAFTRVAMLPPDHSDYLADHSLTTSSLSIAIAARLGWAERDVRLAGLSGLVSDVGMGLVSPRIRSARRRLDEAETNRILRHPTHAVAVLDNLQGLPESVKLAAYQHQERENGQGYPNGLPGADIGDLARVVAVADSFAAAIHARPYKQGRRPYDALEELIMLGAQGVLDRRTVRALISATGLYPVGSFVRLSTGELAEVRRLGSERVDRPVVVIAASPRDPARVGTEIDLAELPREDVTVARADDPPAREAA